MRLTPKYNCLNYIFFIVLHFVYCNDEFDNLPSFNIEHSFDNGIQFLPKGNVTIRSLASGTAHYSGDKALTEAEINSIKKLVNRNSFYRVRVILKSPLKEEIIENSMPACHLLEGNLSMSLVMSIDGSGCPVGLFISPSHSGNIGACKSSSEELIGRLSSLNQPTIKTVAKIQSPAIGAAPETHEFIKKVEKQREEKMKAEMGDNRSFFAKYWYYIVPAVLFMMMASNAGDQAAGGGR